MNYSTWNYRIPEQRIYQLNDQNPFLAHRINFVLGRPTDSAAN